MKNIYLIFLFALLLPAIAVAQNDYTRFGIRFGIGGSTLTGLDAAPGRVSGYLLGSNFETENLEVNTQFSFDLGFTLQRGFGKNNFIQADFIVSRLGANLKGVYEIDESGYRLGQIRNINLTYFQIPVYFGKTIPLQKKGLNFIFAMGPYMSYDLPIDNSVAEEYFIDEDWGYDDGYGIADYNESDGGTTKVFEEELNSKNTAFRHFDFGLMGLVGIQSNSFQLALNPQMGLTRLVKGGPDVRHRGLRLSFAFMF